VRTSFLFGFRNLFWKVTPETMKLASKFYASLIGILILGLFTCCVALFSAWRMDTLIQRLISRDMAGIRAAEELAMALLKQRGLAASFILSGGDDHWLEALAVQEPQFHVWLSKARHNAMTSEAQTAISELAEIYQSYHLKRNEAIALYERKQVTRARKVLVEELNPLYDQAHMLCERFIGISEAEINMAVLQDRQRIEQYMLWVSLSTGIAVLMGVGLIWMFVYGVLVPLRKMAKEAQAITPVVSGQALTAPGDELRTLGIYLHTLMSDVKEARVVLAQSRNQLLQAEKLASVGKLAASVAHEIRNPLTSVKMRLYSIRHVVGNDPLLEDDLQVVSEELVRLENIVRDFLDFSRPAEPKLQRVCLAKLVDKTLGLVKSSVASQNIEVVCHFEDGFFDVWADPEHMMQVLINLFKNAFEAIGQDGKVYVTVSSKNDTGGHWGLVRIADTGSGIPLDKRSRIFEPFFSTKETGTGLGLSIVAQIMLQHGGYVELDSSVLQGTAFVIHIPMAEGVVDG